MIWRVTRLLGDTCGNTWPDERFKTLYVEAASRKQIESKLEKSFGGYDITPCSVHSLTVAASLLKDKKKPTGFTKRTYKVYFNPFEDECPEF